MASLYEKKFAKKLAEGDKRVLFIWQDHASFRQQWIENASAFTKDIVIVDEVDMFLTRDISGRAVTQWPKSFILLSATSKNSWSKYQELCFLPGKGKLGIYLDVSKVFPQSR